jgi:hypothetical protein
LIDEVITEPLGGAHRNIHDAVYNVEKYIVRTLRELKRVKIDELLERRYKKLRSIGNDFTKNNSNSKKKNSKALKIKTTKSISRKRKPLSARV